MAESFLFYYITDRAAFPGDERIRRLRLLDKIAECASSGVDYIQLREKDLPARELELLARESVSIIRNLRNLKTKNQTFRTALLINSRTDIALTTAADGVHLPADDVSPEEVRTVWARSAPSTSSEPAPGRERLLRDPLISVSCHSLREVSQSATNHATIAIFAPVFEKKDAPGTNAAGLNALGEACRAKIPVLALGGITLDNAESCIRAGAAGIAAIRLFQENDVSSIVRKLRS